MNSYDPHELYELSIEALGKHDIITMEDLIDHLPCSKPTFYVKLKDGTDEFNAIKKLLNKNKIEVKKRLRKFFGSAMSTPAERIFLYKILSNEEERMAYNPPKIESEDRTPVEHRITLTHEPLKIEGNSND
jgi:hypothetical protein